MQRNKKLSVQLASPRSLVEHAHDQYYAYRVRLKKTYHDKNLIFSQTDRKFKTKFSTLILNIYAHISIKYY